MRSNTLFAGVCILLCFSACVSAVGNATIVYDYARASNRPLIIAHRGYASLFPENTLESFRAAIYAGADFFELDIQLTKDFDILVSHDAYLSRVTDIASRPEFASKKQTRVLSGKNVSDWWICDFTLLELKTLHIKQTLVKGRNQDLNYYFTFPLLSEVLDMLLQFNGQIKGSRNLDNRLAGVVIESKNRQFYIDYFQIEQGQLIVDLLKEYKLDNKLDAALVAPIILHSFDAPTVQLWHNITDLPNSQLGSFSSLPFPLNTTATYAQIVGLEISSLYNNTSSQSTGQIEQAKAAGLMVHGWTFRDDSLNWGNNSIEQYTIAYDLGLTGIITEFPESAMSVVYMLRQQAEKQEQMFKGDISRE